MTESQKSKLKLSAETKERWSLEALGFLADLNEDEPCPGCEKQVKNHDDYTFVVRYWEGDSSIAAAELWHTKCNLKVYGQGKWD